MFTIGRAHRRGPLLPVAVVLVLMLVLSSLLGAAPRLHHSPVGGKRT